MLDEVKLTELGVLQRCSIHCVSETDKKEAEMVGRRAVQYALDGQSGFMTALSREKSETEYRCSTQPVRLSEVCSRVRPLPREWIGENGKLDGMRILRYMGPLIFDTGEYGALAGAGHIVDPDAFRSLKQC